MNTIAELLDAIQNLSDDANELLQNDGLFYGPEGVAVRDAFSELEKRVGELPG